MQQVEKPMLLKIEIALGRGGIASVVRVASMIQLINGIG